MPTPNGVTNSTYIRTREGWLYLYVVIVVIDLYAGNVRLVDEPLPGSILLGCVIGYADE